MLENAAMIVVYAGALGLGVAVIGVTLFLAFTLVLKLSDRWRL